MLLKSKIQMMYISKTHDGYFEKLSFSPDVLQPKSGDIAETMVAVYLIVHIVIKMIILKKKLVIFITHSQVMWQHYGVKNTNQ